MKWGGWIAVAAGLFLIWLGWKGLATPLNWLNNHIPGKAIMSIAKKGEAVDNPPGFFYNQTIRSIERQAAQGKKTYQPPWWQRIVLDLTPGSGGLHD